MRIANAAVVLAAAGLSLAGCRDAAAPDANDVVISEDGATLNSPPPSLPPSQAFANAVITGNDYEVALARMADLNSSASAKTKAFAAKVIADHNAVSDKLRIALASLDPPPMAKSDLTQDQEGMLVTLRPKRGADFDAAFKTAQVAAHEEALATLRDYARNGDTPVLVEFATSMEPVVAGHLAIAQAL